MRRSRGPRWARSRSFRRPSRLRAMRARRRRRARIRSDHWSIVSSCMVGTLCDGWKCSKHSCRGGLMPTFACHLCGGTVAVDEPLSREATCESCGNDLRCCRNCRHYDTSRNNDCRETMADPVVEKTRRNFCEYFSFNREGPTAPGRSRQSEARAQLEQLFRKSPGPDDSSGTAGKK